MIKFLDRWKFMIYGVVFTTLFFIPMGGISGFGILWQANKILAILITSIPTIATGALTYMAKKEL